MGTSRLSFSPRRLAFAAFTLILVQLAAAAWATTSLYATLPELSRLSTAVVIARVGAVRQGVDAEIHRPMLETTLEVQEVVAGKAPSRLDVVQIGGTSQGRTTRVPGDATLAERQEGVFFLREVGGRWYLTALEQSVFRIVRDPTGVRLERDLGEGLVVRAPDGTLLPYDELEPPVKNLDDLRRIVQAAGVRGGAR